MCISEEGGETLGEVSSSRVPKFSSLKYREMHLGPDGGGVSRLLSHHVGRGIRRNMKLPSAKLALGEIPQS